MAKDPKRTPEVMSQKTKEPARDDPGPALPVGEAVGWVKVPGGWVAVFLRFQGETIVDKEILCEASSKAIAQEQVKLGAVRRLFSPRN